MVHVTQIDGAPGTGKTHTLKEKLREEAADGVEPSEFWWVTFTRAGRADVVPEIESVYPDADDVDNRARTMHSLALRLLTLYDHIELEPEAEGPHPIISHGKYDDDQIDPYQRFCDIRGMRYDPRSADPRKLLSDTDTTEYAGNKLFAINDYLRQTCKPVEKHREAPIDLRASDDRIQELLREWRDFKREHFPYRLYEHGDYLDKAYQVGVSPVVDVLIVDEFQDFAPLEYRLYKQWRDMGYVDRIYLAGDPNQSVYSFRGGTPYYFNQTHADTEITLSESYRCPREIARVGNAVLSAHEATDPRGFHGRSTGGSVEWHSDPDEWDIHDLVGAATERYIEASTAAMLLTRTRRQLSKLTRVLRNVGVPFEVLGNYGGVWRGELRQMLTFLNNYANERQTHAVSNVECILDALPNGDAHRDSLDGGDRLGVIDRENFEGALEGFASPVELIQHLQLKNWKRDVLTNAVKAPSAVAADEVKVGTIHAAKGLEAPAVFLFTSTTKRMVQRCHRDEQNAAEEHRLYYVGTTRAMEELHLVTEFFEAPTAPPIDKIRGHRAVVT